MRIFAASPPPKQTSEDLIESGLLNGWPYLLMVNALGEENSLAAFVHAEITNKLPSLFQALCAMKNPDKKIISDACDALIDELQKKFDMGKKFEDVHPVTFTVVMMLPSTGDSRKVACFGLGNNMAVVERAGEFITVKPAILIDGHSRSVPCIMRSQREKIFELKKEIEEHIVLMKLQANDTVYLLSPECHQFLPRVSTHRENVESISLSPKQEVSSFSKLESLLMKKLEAQKKLAFEKKLSDNAYARQLLENQILILKEQLKPIQANRLWQRRTLAAQLAELIEERNSQSQNKEVLTESMSKIIAEHNKLSVSYGDEADFFELSKKDKYLRSELDNLEYRLNEMLSPDTYDNPDPDFTHVSMLIPEKDISLFQLRMEVCMRKVDKAFNHAAMQARSRIPDSSEYNESSMTLNNYCTLFKVIFKNSILGRFLIVLAIRDSVFGELLLQEIEKPRFDDLIFDADQKQAIRNIIDLLQEKPLIRLGKISETVLELEKILSAKEEPDVLSQKRF